MITYILIFTLIAFIHVAVYLLKANKRLRIEKEIWKGNNIKLQNGKKALEVKITELQTKLDTYNGEY